MLKKKKTTASGKLVLVKSVRRHWTSGGCPLSADRSGTETAQPQNEILCSKGLGALPRASKRRGKSRRDFLLCGPVCINTGIACHVFSRPSQQCNFSLNTSPDTLCFFGYSYIMYHVEYYPCGGAI